MRCYAVFPKVPLESIRRMQKRCRIPLNYRLNCHSGDEGFYADWCTACCLLQRVFSHQRSWWNSARSPVLRPPITLLWENLVILTSVLLYTRNGARQPYNHLITASDDRFFVNGCPLWVKTVIQSIFSAVNRQLKPSRLDLLFATNIDYG